MDLGVDLGVDLGGRGVSGGLPLRIRKNQWIWEWIWESAPPGIYKLFTTGKSHAPAHINVGKVSRNVYYTVTILSRDNVSGS